MTKPDPMIGLGRQQPARRERPGQMIGDSHDLSERVACESAHRRGSSNADDGDDAQLDRRAACDRDDHLAEQRGAARVGPLEDRRRSDDAKPGAGGVRLARRAPRINPRICTAPRVSKNAAASGPGAERSYAKSLVRKFARASSPVSRRSDTGHGSDRRWGSSGALTHSILTQRSNVGLSRVPGSEFADRNGVAYRRQERQYQMIEQKSSRRFKRVLVQRPGRLAGADRSPRPDHMVAQRHLR